MGLRISFQYRPCHTLELIHTIHINDIKSLKKKFRYAEIEDLKILFLEAIRKERKEFFDFLFEKLILSNNLCDSIKSGYYEKCFTISLNCSDVYYPNRFLEMYNFLPKHKRAVLLQLAVHSENEFIAEQLILKGVDINDFHMFGLMPLYIAVKCNNINLVCMLLYYGAETYELLGHNLTSFMYSIILQSTEDIQRILLDYEANLNLTWHGTSTLFFAIQHKSPLLLDIIERGADVSYYDGTNNSISLAMLYDCDANAFKTMWDKFDYDTWRISYSKSVLLKFLETEYISEWEEYLNILMENESKLKMDLAHHNNSYFYTSDPIISVFYSWCIDKNMEQDTIESFVLHLLSLGAHIFEEDFDSIYILLGAMTPFLHTLLYMDLQNSDNSYYSIMYFKYKVVPDIVNFLVNVIYPTSIFLDTLKYVRNYYAINDYLKLLILDLLGCEDVNYEACKQIFNESITFPSLAQLSRDSFRKSLYLKYAVKNSCKMYTIIKYLNISKHVEDILIFNTRLYHFPM